MLPMRTYTTPHQKEPRYLTKSSNNQDNRTNAKSVKPSKSVPLEKDLHLSLPRFRTKWTWQEPNVMLLVRYEHVIQNTKYVFQDASLSKDKTHSWRPKPISPEKLKSTSDNRLKVGFQAHR